MKEISLNILDIAQNSVSAEASLVQIHIDEQPEKDTLTVEIIDNGRGMDAEFLKNVTDPFTTTRTTRKVGMGIPLFKLAAEQSGGTFEIESVKFKGTRVRAVFGYSSIDRMPIGDMAGTVSMLIQGCPQVDFEYIHILGDEKFVFDTREIRLELGEDLPLNAPEVMAWIQEYLKEGIPSMK